MLTTGQEFNTHYEPFHCYPRLVACWVYHRNYAWLGKEASEKSLHLVGGTHSREHQYRVETVLLVLSIVYMSMNAVVEWLALLLCIRKVPDSNLGTETGCLY
jgi:hypothetical protein